jgi:hypothetical protein
MDTTQLASDGAFSWDTSVVASPAVALHGNQLGVLACTALCDPTMDPIYLLAAMAAPAGGSRSDYFIVVQAQRELGSDGSRSSILIRVGTPSGGPWLRRVRAAECCPGSRRCRNVRSQ